MKWYWEKKHVEDAVQLSADGREGRFQLVLGTPSTVPYALSAWEITIERGAGGNRLTFQVPDKVIFAESYPAA